MVHWSRQATEENGFNAGSNGVVYVGKDAYHEIIIDMHVHLGMITVIVMD